MKFLANPILLLTIVLVFSCSSNKIKENKRILADDVYAEGNIDSDSVYNGKIKFYDTATNNLVEEAEYKDGILHGYRTKFYSNSKIQVKQNYRDGKISGYVKFYEKDGVLKTEQYYYYDLVVGPTIEYKNGKPKYYFFTSFENEELFFLDYDSIQEKRIDQINKSFFFYNIYEVAKNIDKINDIEQEFFLYLVNPPNYEFSYSLCIIKENYEIIKEVTKFDKGKIWDTFIISKNDLKEGELYALKLEVNNRLPEDLAVMFKKLYFKN